MPTSPHEEPEPYIFVSYSREDKDVVYSVIERLQAEGRRIWYDQGILTAAQWPDEIERKLRGCTWFMVFLSPRSVQSEWVRREVQYADSQKKPIYPVYLEATDLPDGMGILLQARQAIFKFELDETTFFRAFMELLMVT